MCLPDLLNKAKVDTAAVNRSDVPRPHANKAEGKHFLLSAYLSSRGALLDWSPEMQVCTQLYGRRPYGVGMLVAGYDVRLKCSVSLIVLSWSLFCPVLSTWSLCPVHNVYMYLPPPPSLPLSLSLSLASPSLLSQSTGPHLLQTCPSSNCYDCRSMAIGARSQVRGTLPWCLLGARAMGKGQRVMGRGLCVTFSKAQNWC